jgi:hypothetical protein
MPRYMTPNQPQDDHLISSDEDSMAGPRTPWHNQTKHRRSHDNSISVQENGFSEIFRKQMPSKTVKIANYYFKLQRKLLITNDIHMKYLKTSINRHI